MRKWLLMSSLLGALLLAAFGGNALAQIEPGFNLSLNAGGHVFEGNQNLSNQPYYGVGLGYNFSKVLGFEGLFNYVDSRFSDDTSGNVNVYTLRGELLYHFLPDNKLVPYVAGGLGLMQRDPDNLDEDTDFLFAYGAGLKYFVDKDRAFRFDVRHLLNYNDADKDRSGDIIHNLTYGAGFQIQFGGGRAPMESIPPAEAAPEPAAKPAEEKVVVAAQEPSAAPVASEEMENVSGAGVPDAAAEEVVASVQLLDSDFDGVLDTLDKCPDTPEGVLVDYKGCPPVISKPVSLTLHLQFESGSARILPEHHAELAEAAQFIRNNPGSRVVVEGHTDSVGPTGYNLKLSQQRAESVRLYLIENFRLDAQTIGAQGYGEEEPVADNATAEGRHTNRRVVVTVLP